MLSRLIGTIQSIEAQAVELFCAPFSFWVQTPKTFGMTVGNQQEFFTHIIVKEDGMSLFGFTSIKERELFLQLLKVHSIGPKLAFVIMQTNMQDFVAACQRQDKDLLCAIPGIGAKTAARILAEINIDALPLVSSYQEHYYQAKKMLLNLGFAENKIDVVLPQCPQHSLDDLVKAALKLLGERSAKSNIVS